MAELLLKGRDSGKWRKGDVVDAFNDRRILLAHAQMICDHRKYGYTSEGLRPQSIAEEYQRIVFPYRFDRDGSEVIRTDLKTGEQIRFGKTPIILDNKQQYINVEEYLFRRACNPNHRLFGKIGSEYWYGGVPDRHCVLQVWDMIEANTLLRRENHSRWPYGSEEVPPRFYVALTDDFSDEFARELTRAVTIDLPDGAHKMIRPRAYSYPDLPSFIDLQDIQKAA